MGRPRKPANAPVYAERDAVMACRAIRDGRARAGDPDVRLLPAEVHVDAEDVDAVLAYCEQHREVRDRQVLVDELRARAVLLVYREQLAAREARRRERQLLRLLDDVHAAVTGVATARPTAWHTQPLGLTAQNAYMTRRALRKRLDTDDDQEQRGPTGPLSTWLLTHRDELAEVGELLVDQRPDVLDLVADPARREQLAGLIDDVGASIAPLPDLEFADRVVAALECWWSAGPVVTGDPVLRDLDSRGLRLAAGYRQAVTDAT